MSENRLFLSGEENKYSIVIASIVKYLDHSFFFYIISYYDFEFTSAYNSILFCCLRRNVEPYDTLRVYLTCNKKLTGSQL